MKQVIRCFYIVTTLVLLVACASASADKNTPEVASGAIVKPNLAQTQTVPINVLTNRYNDTRTGENLNETILNLTNVNVNQFGKLFTRKVEGDIYAQPLYVQSVDMPDKTEHNIVYVATMHNMVYAFDADDPNQANPLWKVSLGTPYTKSVLFDIPGGEIGILSTPVIDLKSQTIFLVTRNQENDKGLYRLHALNMLTGENRTGSPVQIDISVQGKGLKNINGVVKLDNDNQLQRTGLLFLDGHLYFSFGSNNDHGDWFGWLVAYNATTLVQEAVFNSTPDAYQGGIWMGGTGISTDGTYLYLVVANGVDTVTKGGRDYAMSILKMKQHGDKFDIVDYYVPTNYDQLNKDDSGLGSTGVILIPNTDLMVAGGKDGNLYSVGQKKLGGFDPKTDTSLGIFSVGSGGMFVTPTVWDSGPNGKPTIYAWNIEDTLRAFNVNTEASKLIPQPVSESTLKSVGRPTGGITISAKGTDLNTGILWATFAPEADKNPEGRGTLVAFDATNLKHLLWYSDLNKNRDALGLLSKFSSPTVANGKVYVATFSDELVVYGLLDSPVKSN